MLHDEKSVPPASLNNIGPQRAATSPRDNMLPQWQIAAGSSKSKSLLSIWLELSFVTFLCFKTKKSKRPLRTSMATFRKLLSSDPIKFRQRHYDRDPGGLVQHLFFVE